jgi:hypothetical protein
MARSAEEDALRSQFRKQNGAGADGKSRVVAGMNATQRRAARLDQVKAAAANRASSRGVPGALETADQVKRDMIHHAVMAHGDRLKGRRENRATTVIATAGGKWGYLKHRQVIPGKRGAAPAPTSPKVASSAAPKAPGRGTPERLRAAKFLAEKRRAKNAAKGGSYSAEGIARSEYNAARAVVGSGTPQRLLKRKTERTRAEVAAKQAARNEMRSASARRRWNDTTPGIRHFGDELAMPGQKPPGRMTRDEVAARLKANRAASPSPSAAPSPAKPSLRQQADAARRASSGCWPSSRPPAS